MNENESLVKIKKTIKITGIVIACCFLISFFCFFIGQMWIPLGFIIGYIFSCASMIVLYKFSYYFTRPHTNYKWLNFLSFTSRLLIYGAGFACCIIPQHFGYYIFFWGTCFASYMIMTIVLTIVFNRA